MTRSFALILAVWCGLALWPLAPCAAFAQERQPATDSLDDELLKGLEGDLDDGLAPPINDRRTPPDSSPADDLDRQLLEGLEGGEDLGGQDDPLIDLSRQMRRVESLLRRARADEPTQQLEQNISEQLTQLIEQARQQAQSSRSSGGSQPMPPRDPNGPPADGQPSDGEGAPSQRSQQPAADSTDRLGAAETARPDPARMQALLKSVWGHLPDRLRDAMMQNPAEEFLPKYELEIEAYFQGLLDIENERP